MDILYHETIEPEYGMDILELVEEFSPTVLVFADNKLYVNEINERTDRYTRISSMEANLRSDLQSIALKGLLRYYFIMNQKK